MGRIFGNVGGEENWLSIWSDYRLHYTWRQIFQFFYHNARRMNVGKIMSDEVGEFGHQATTDWFDPHIKWGKSLWFANEQIDAHCHACDSYLRAISFESGQRELQTWLVPCGFPQSLQTHATQCLKLCRNFLPTHSQLFTDNSTIQRYVVYAGDSVLK